MVGDFFGYEISIGSSLAVILLILASGIGLSVALPPETLPGDDVD